MKNPEEIKKGIICCNEGGKCNVCPYGGDYVDCFGDDVWKDALRYIEELEAQLEDEKKNYLHTVATGYEDLAGIMKKFPFCYATSEEIGKWLFANGVVLQKWISVNQEPPKEEVLAANFAKGTHGYKEQIVGYVYEDSQSNKSGYCAESGSEILLNVTHWMPLPKEPI